MQADLSKKKLIFRIGDQFPVHLRYMDKKCKG